MSHFVKNGFWYERQKGLKGDLNLENLIRNVVGTTSTTSSTTTITTTLNPSQFEEYDIRLYGASTSNTPDQNRIAILAAINAANTAGGGRILIPDGEFIVTKTPGIAVFNLNNVNNIWFIGNGIKFSKITLAPGSYPGDTHIFSFTNCTNIAFKGLTLYGNRGNHIVDNEQMHGIRTFDCSYFRVEDVNFDRLRGDGIFLLGNTSNSKIWVDICQFYQCGRSGVTIQRLNRFLNITNCYFEDINDQAIDSEPTGGVGYDETNIEGNFFYWATPRNIGVTLGGSDSQGVNFINNQIINAGLFSTSLSNSKIAYNVIQGPLALLETADNVTISNNDIASTGKCINIYYQNAQPQNFLISSNRCITTSTTENIIEVQIDGVTIENNKCIASASTGTTGTGILVSAPTISGSQYKEIYIINNKVYSCNTGITISASSAKTWQTGYILNNIVKDLRTVKTIQYGINLSGPAYYYFEELFVDKNSFDLSLSQTNQIVLNASGCSWYKINASQFAGIIEPEAAISANYNTIYNYIGLPYRYTKTIDGGNTGWIEKNLQLPNVLVNDDLLQNPQANINTHVPNTSLIGVLAWTNNTGQHDCLTSSEATAVTLSGGTAICTLNIGLANGILQSNVRTGVAGNEYAGIIFRLSDASNYWAFQISAGLDTIRIIKVVAGVTTVVSSASVVIPATGQQVLRVEFDGNAIGCFYNGGSQLSAYDSFNVAATNHGLVSNVTSRYYFKDLKFSV